MFGPVPGQPQAGTGITGGGSGYASIFGARGWLKRNCDFVTVESVVTESSTGPRKRFMEMTVAHVGVHGWVSPGSLLSGTRLSYGASAVARVSDRGRVAEE